MTYVDSRNYYSVVMSRTVSRLLLTLSLLVGSVTTYTLLFLLLERPWGDDAALAFASLATAPVFAVLWTYIWRSDVVWSARRVGRTMVVFAVGSMAGVACYAICTSVRGYEEVGILAGTLWWMTIWMAGTALVWRETGVESSRRKGTGPERVIPCPKCGYDLKGLAMARCPECGTEFTLDELFAAWVGQDSGLDE